MNGDLQSTFNVKASVNGKELSPESVASVLGVLFKGGWLDDVLRSALGAQSIATEQTRLDLERHMQTLQETLRRATNTAQATAGEQSEEPQGEGEGSSA